MNETPLFFEAKNYNLFGVLHRPDNCAVKKAFVLCHPFAEEKLWTHRVYVNIARELAKQGYAVLRFDYMGNGDSEGEFEESTVRSNIDDINAAIEFIKSTFETLEDIGLLGMRLGSTLACQIAEKRDDIKQLILWDPILDGSRYMQEILRSNLTTQLAVYGEVTKNREMLIAEMKDGHNVNHEGYELSYAYFEGVSSISLLLDKKEFKGKVLIVQLGKQGQPLNKNTEKLSEMYTNVETKLVVEAPFWREIKEYYSRAENLFQTTVDWVGQA